MASGFQADELHVEGEGGVGWDDARVTFTAVGIIWRADESGPLAHAHLWTRLESAVDPAQGLHTSFSCSPGRLPPPSPGSPPGVRS